MNKGDYIDFNIAAITELNKAVEFVDSAKRKIVNGDMAVAENELKFAKSSIAAVETYVKSYLEGEYDEGKNRQ